jgi:tyrosyl-tRNA synthetase
VPDPGNVRIPDDETLRHITTRAVAEIVPYQEFVDGLRSGRPLRFKIGLDPTKPVITLGWTVPLRKLRRLQDLGHTVVVIVGDWTARIGDPSGQSQTRPMLTEDEVNANCDAILPQFYTVLDESRTEIRRQSEWFDKFTLTDVVRLSARFTAAQILQRDDFAQRYAEHKPIGLHELTYPLLQAYDSVAIEADVEFGGTDQKFNNLVGRDLQRMLGQKSGPAGEGQAVFLVPLLVGLDGKQKMSQSLGNFIAIDDPPHDMYGKLMSIPDSLMMEYFELLTDIPNDELSAIRKSIDERSENPMDHKMRLARDIVTQFHGEEAAAEAEDGFVRTFRKGEQPDEAVEVSLGTLPQAKRSASAEEAGVQSYDIGSAIHVSGLAPSLSEARRLIKQGAVEIEGRKIVSNLNPLEPGMVIRVGKHRFLRIVDADKHPEA